MSKSFVPALAVWLHRPAPVTMIRAASAMDA
jgi:hypothetical protein